MSNPLLSFFIHHEAHEGHEERTTGLKKRPDFIMIFSSFVLFVSFVVVIPFQKPNLG